MAILTNDFLTNAVLTNHFLTNGKTPSVIHFWQISVKAKYLKESQKFK